MTSKPQASEMLISLCKSFDEVRNLVPDLPEDQARFVAISYFVGAFNALSAVKSPSRIEVCRFILGNIGPRGQKAIREFLEQNEVFSDA